MARKVLMVALAALALSAPLAAAPARAEAAEVGNGEAGMALAVAESVRLGPFATVDRANQVANQYRSMGYNAQVIPIHTLGGYFVDVW